MQEKRALMLTTTLPGKIGDGTPQFVYTLAKEMGCNVDIVAPRIHGGKLVEKIDNVTIFRIPYAPKRWENLADEAIMPALREDRKKWLQVPLLVASLGVSILLIAIMRKPTVIHGHWILPGGLLAFLISKIVRVPYIVTAHGADIHTIKGKQGRKIMKKILESSSGNFPVSQEISNVMEDISPDSTAFVTPMGINFMKYEKIRRDREPKSRKVLFVGRLAEKKGLNTLIEVAEKNQDYNFVIVGDGPDRQQLMYRAKNLDNVEFLGNQTQEQVFEHYRTAAMIMIPSIKASNGDKEGTPVVLAEAMTCGVPIIASDIAGLGEQITSRHNGILCEPESVESFSNSIKEMEENLGLREKIIENGLSHARQHLDIPEICRKMLEYTK